MTSMGETSNVAHMDSATLSWTLGDRLAKARRHGNVSTGEMAEALGVSRKTINNYEADRTPIRVGAVRVWALRCGVAFEWLRDGVAPADETGQGDQWNLWSPPFARSA